MIHPDAFIHPSAVVEDGASIGAGTKVWHQCHIRSGAVIGNNCTLGKGVFVDTSATIGNGVKIQNHVSVYQGVTLEDDVFVGPLAVFTNDPHPRAFLPWDASKIAPTRIRRGASICAGACIRCGVTVGEYAMVAMGAVQLCDTGDYELWAGNPAVLKGRVDQSGHLVERFGRS